MGKRCAICNKSISECSGKLKGTMIKVKDEKGKTQIVYVCSKCEKQKNWIEKAVIKAA